MKKATKTKWARPEALTGPPTEDMVRRFYQLCGPDPTSPCVLWAGARDQKGYGLFRAALLPGRRVKAHRFAWLLQHGSLPAGLQVDHLCRNRACVNTNHLRLLEPAEHARASNARKRELRQLAEVDDVL